MIDFQSRPTDDGRPERNRRVLLVAVLAVVSLLVGAAGAAGAMYLLGWRPQAARVYTMQVILDVKVTAAQKEGVRVALDDAPDVSDIQFRSKAEAYARSQEIWKDKPEMLEYLKPDSLPEIFEATMTTTDFTCDTVKNIQKLSGVDKARVALRFTKTRPGAEMAC